MDDLCTVTPEVVHVHEILHGIRTVGVSVDLNRETIYLVYWQKILLAVVMITIFKL